MKNQVQEIASLLQILASQKMPQTELANQSGLNYGQMNRFLNGHSDMYLSNFIDLCKVLDIDLLSIVKEKTMTAAQLHNQKFENAEDCLVYLYKNLDPLGRQTYLNQLAWASRTKSKGTKKFPAQVEEILKRETSHV